MKKSTIIKILIGIVVLAIVVGIYYTRDVIGGTSSVGTTQSTQKEALITWTLSTGATTTSLYNGDANDRVIETAKYACTGIGTSYTQLTGAGLATLYVTAATTSTSIPATLGTNTNYVFTSANTFATSTGFAYLASTTPGELLTNTSNRLWLAGSYLTFASNATNTATCVIGVEYSPM